MGAAARRDRRRTASGSASPATNCHAEGRYFTADYAGVLREDLHARYGGEVLYFNGALGVLIGPGGAHVWEVDRRYPLGNQLVAPAGAVGPGGGTDYTQRNFRRTAIIGEQLALAVDAAARRRGARGRRRRSRTTWSPSSLV